MGGGTELSAQEDLPDSGEVTGEPADLWDVLPDPDEPVPAYEEHERTGAYRGRRRAVARPRNRLALTAAVVAAVGVVLVGSSLAVRSFSAPVAAPVVPPSQTPARSPSPLPPPLPPPIDEPSPIAGLGAAPEPSPPPTSAPPEPSTPAPSEQPPDDPPSDPPEPGPVSLALEAESAQLAGDVEVVSEPRASGGAVVDLDGSGSWCLVRFPGAALGQGGRYDLTIHYISRSRDTGVWVSVNDGGPGAVELPETSGNSIGTRSVRVRLDAGDNVIVIASPSCDDAPRLDLITITG